MTTLTKKDSAKTKLSPAEKIIAKYGYAPEHNFEWFQCQPEEGDKNVFVEIEGKYGLMTIETPGKKEVCIFSSPVAPKPKRAEILLDYLKNIFASGEFLKAELELEDGLCQDFLKIVPAQMKARRDKYALAWPVYNLSQFDETLSGNKWKSLRKAKNKFYKNHSVKIVDAKEYKDKDGLYKIIDSWKKKRGARDKAYFSEYKKLIDSNFSPATEARVMVVDGQACGINAGWLIPNSQRYYGAVGMHNYAFDGLGDALYLEDLEYLKKKGYKEADMGGGEKELTAFKTKYHPQFFYKTHIFTVIKS